MDAQALPAPPPEPPPEAALIRRARQARGLTMAQAAVRSSVVKASRWGQIENGYLMKGGAPVRTGAGSMQLAHMARVVGLSPDRLEEAGRDDAAEILREILRQEEDRPLRHVHPDMSDRLERAIWGVATLPEDTRRELIHLVRLGREAESRSM